MHLIVVELTFFFLESIWQLDISVAKNLIRSILSTEIDVCECESCKITRFVSIVQEILRKMELIIC